MGFLSANALQPGYDPIPGHHGYRVGARIARVQIAIASVLGLSAFLIFCGLRRKYPRIYLANLRHANQKYLPGFLRQKLPPLPASLFGWIKVVLKIDEAQVLELAGLDAMVVLGFFKMSIKALAVCVVFAVTVISPVRYKYTGWMDFPDDPLISTKKLFHPFLWMYTVFTYVFTMVVLYFLFLQSAKIIDMRQKYLGHQNAITDRTIKLLGIPPYLRQEDVLKKHIDSLGVGKVDSVIVVKEWNALNRLFRMRKRVLRRLEELWVTYFRRVGMQNVVDMSNSRIESSLGDAVRMEGTYRDDGSSVYGDDSSSGYRHDPGAYRDDPVHRDSAERDGQGARDGFEAHRDSANAHTGILRNGDPSYRGYSRGSTPGVADDANWGEVASLSPTPAASVFDEISEHLEDTEPPEVTESRPRIRKGWWGLFGAPVDAISHDNDKLKSIDKEIRKHRLREFPPSSTAFITMHSVAQAQMLAQAVLDPKLNHLITTLAPAPHDIIWSNLCLTRQERNLRIFMVMLFIGLVSVLMVFPVIFLTNFLNINTIAKVAPALGEFLKSHQWAENLITGILPPYVFTLFNVVMPYFYIWITKRQGFTSHGDEELSSVLKNFFYIFVNLFLVFTLFGTATLNDTTQLAFQLAKSLRELSLFYVDFIILQGIGIFPYKLLLLGNLLKYSIGNWFWCKTPRDYLRLYRPPVFNFGLQLPQPILILIITITYSVISTKILSAGLIYFLLGYFVFKYQLLYACVHPPHNTGKVWPLVVRRVSLGLVIFHITMFGTLASEKAYACALTIIPLPLLTPFVLWYFHEHYIPLSTFIALRSIKNVPFGPDEEHNLLPVETTATRQQTLDERRERNQTYEYPNLVRALDGPILAVDHDEVLLLGEDGATSRKRIHFLG